MCISKSFGNAKCIITCKNRLAETEKGFQELCSELRSPPFWGPSRIITYSQKLLIDIHYN